MHNFRVQEEREKQAQQRGTPAIDPDCAATKIQKVWKGFAQRKKTKQLRQEEFEFIGMVRIGTVCITCNQHPLVHTCKFLIIIDNEFCWEIKSSSVKV